MRTSTARRRWRLRIRVMRGGSRLLGMVRGLRGRRRLVVLLRRGRVMMRGRRRMMVMRLHDRSRRRRRNLHQTCRTAVWAGLGRPAQESARHVAAPLAARAPSVAGRRPRSGRERRHSGKRFCRGKRNCGRERKGKHSSVDLHVMFLSVGDILPYFSEAAATTIWRPAKRRTRPRPPCR